MTQLLQSTKTTVSMVPIDARLAPSRPSRLPWIRRQWQRLHAWLLAPVPFPRDHWYARPPHPAALCELRSCQCRVRTPETNIATKSEPASA
jgi:hypothetical protein